MISRYANLKGAQLKQIKSAEGKLLHFTLGNQDFLDLDDSRTDVIDHSQFMQLAIMSFSEGRFFPAHAHLPREKTFADFRAQESWVVMSGKVQVTYFDEEDAIIAKEILGVGDCSVTLFGGHAYEVIEGPAKIYEFKIGPYEGKEVDKRLII
jgi:hypothetical protein